MLHGGRCRLPLSFPMQGLRSVQKSCWPIQRINWPVTNNSRLSILPINYRVPLRGSCCDGSYLDCCQHRRGSLPEGWRVFQAGMTHYFASSKEVNMLWIFDELLYSQF